VERTAAIDVDADACPCCGVAVCGEWLAEVGRCEACAGFPFSLAPGCNGKHADELRIWLLGRVQAGQIEPMRAMALLAIDDAHRAGGVREGGGGRWLIDRPAPDPNAWDRLRRIEAVNGTIQTVVATFVGPEARRPWIAAEVRRLLVERLTRLSRLAGSTGIWMVTVESPRQIDIQPPTDYIQADTKDTRRRDTVDGLVREALVT
jgi:hypothetical protein